MCMTDCRQTGTPMRQAYDFYAGSDGKGEAAARALLETREDGLLMLWNAETGQPGQTFMHYVYHEESGHLEGHLANSNPMLKQLADLEAQTGTTPPLSPSFMVMGPTAFVPSYWNPGKLAVPTSYYGWVRADVMVRLVSEAAGIVDILNRMTARFQPEGGFPQLQADDPQWQPMLRAITGLDMQITALHSRFKYGQNRSAEKRMEIEGKLRERGLPQDDAVARAVLAHIDQAPEEPA